MIGDIVLGLVACGLLVGCFFLLKWAEKKSIERENRWYELAKRYVEIKEGK